MAAPTTTYRMWKRLSERPGGSRLFSAAAMVRVPYFASIVPHVVRMEPGFAEVTVPKWFFVKRVDLLPPNCRNDRNRYGGFRQTPTIPDVFANGGSGGSRSSNR
jgi:hypothetical protein